MIDPRLISDLRREEGGYVNDPSDTGGETYSGIARKKNPQWSGWPRVDKIQAKIPFVDRPKGITAFNNYLTKILDADPILQKSIAEFVATWWTASGAAMLTNSGLARQFFDTSFNQGKRGAAVLLQRAVGAVEDGALGPDTVSRANSAPDAAMRFYALRCARYRDLADKNPEDRKFLKGWLARAARVAGISLS